MTEPIHNREIYESDETRINEIINEDPTYKVGDIIAIEYDNQVDAEDKRYYIVMMNDNGEKIAAYTTFANLQRGGRKEKRKTRKLKRKSLKRKTNKRKSLKRKSLKRKH